MGLVVLIIIGLIIWWMVEEGKRKTRDREVAAEEAQRLARRTDPSWVGAELVRLTEGGDPAGLGPAIEQLPNWPVRSSADILLTIDDADAALPESAEEREILFRALNDAVKFWAGKPELPGREKITFQAVLLCPPDAREEALHEIRTY